MSTCTGCDGKGFFTDITQPLWPRVDCVPCGATGIIGVKPVADTGHRGESLLTMGGGVFVSLWNRRPEWRPGGIITIDLRVLPSWQHQVTDYTVTISDLSLIATQQLLYPHATLFESAIYEATGAIIAKIGPAQFIKRFNLDAFGVLRNVPPVAWLKEALPCHPAGTIPEAIIIEPHSREAVEKSKSS